ncbi:alpha/beta fold hydrolase, partial [Coleofasciculus sp. LEGE 07092]|nr:alpha/beta fold hydrolase [Coleofasciculus sp. LEGE 07092]
PLPPRLLHLLTLRTKSEKALRQLAGRYADFLASNPQVSLADICFTANTGRSQFPHSLAVTAASTQQLQEHLTAFVAGKESPVQQGQRKKRQKVTFLFTGQGSQYPQMGRQLYENQPLFREVLKQCDELLSPVLNHSLLSVLYPESNSNLLLHKTAYTQPALFALEYALAQLWQSWGIKPDAVIGHSVGEYVAACIAGVFSLEEGLKLIAARGRLMQALPQNGMMAAVFAPEARVREAIAPYKTKLAIAAINGAENTVISGLSEAVQTVLAQLASEDIVAKPLQVSHAFHSSLMEPMLDAFEKIAQGVEFKSPSIPFISNVTGQLLAPGEIPDASYWCRHLREPVQFAAGMQTLQQQGYPIFLEVGPHPVLLGMGRRCLPENTGVWLPSLRKGQEDWQQLLESLGTLYVQGVSVNWTAFDQPYPRHRIPLPTYPFQRSRYWVEGVTVPGSQGAEILGSDFPLSESLTDWFYQVAWRPKTRLDRALPSQPADYIPTPQQIAADIQPQVARLNQQHQLQRYQPLATQLDRLSTAYVLNALAQLGWQPQSGRISLRELSQNLEIVKQHHCLLQRMLQMLQEEGILKQVGGEWDVCQLPQMDDPEQIRQTLLSHYPAFETELTLLGRCGQQLAAVLQGKCDPLELLFPQGSLTSVERLYQDSPVAQVINTLVQDAIAQATAKLPQNRPIRILEIGAGTGGLTSYLLPKLPANRTEYVFTDLSSLFTAKAQQKFQDYPFIQYQLLDIEQNPSTQGFAAHQFDMVIAANVLHATANLRQTLNHVQQLLAPAGLLVLLEGTQPQRWMDLIFGLTEGWWRFTDTDLRKSHPLLSSQQWQNFLEQLGFQEARTISAGEISEALTGQGIILARGSQLQGLPKEVVLPPQPASSWLIFADRGGVGSQLATQLKKQGDHCILVFPGTAYQQLETGDYQLNPSQPREFQQVLAEVFTAELPCRGVVHLWSLDGTSPTALEQALVLGCRSALHLLQALVKSEFPQPPRLWLVTQGTQPIGLEPSPLAVAQSPLWGLGGVAAQEHPELWGGLVDLDGGDTQEQALRLLTQIWQPDGEKQVALRSHHRYVPRLVRSQEQASPAPLNLRDDGTYLITGGLGGLGLKVAQWMVQRGAKSIVLVGRSHPSPGATEAVRSLERSGAKVVVQQVDVSQVAQVARCLKDISESLPPLRGVIHGAGILDDGVLLHQDWQQFVNVLTPKVQGAWNLHSLTQEIPLDFFILFSSAAALLNPPGQGNHAAANRFLDTLAHHRQQQGLPALTINWGAWAEVGAAAKPDVGKRLMLQGVDTIAWEQGIQALEQLMQQPAVQVGVMPIDWGLFVQQLAIQETFLHEVARELEPQDAVESTSLILEQLLALPLTQRQDFVRNYLQQQVAKALGIDGDVPCDRNVMDLGMDSLMVVEILNACKRDLQLTLYPREFYERPQIASLAEYLSNEVERAHGKNQGTLSVKPIPAQDIEMWAWGDRQTVRTYTKPTQRNSAIAFVFSTPRAGSTLLRVMLAGHPGLFSPPELHLLPFEGMAEWSEELGLSYLGEGLQRAFMELMDIDGKGSKKLVDELTQQNISIQQVYGRLQELAGERLLVDKSPSYAASMQTLQRSEELFAGAKYIHLVRHPYAVIESFVRNRIDKILGIEELDPHFVAEQIWVTINRNILEFGQQIEPSRYHQVRYEELVSDPATVMSSLCEFLEVPFDEAILQPYEGKRMTDGVHPESLPINDPNFLKHNKIESALADIWRTIKLPQPLGDSAKQIAIELAYELPTETAIDKLSSVTSVTQSAATITYPMQESYLEVRGLRLCLCSWGPEDRPLIFCLHGILEHGAAWDDIARPLAARGYRVVAPDQRGHGRSDHVGMGGSYQLLDYLGDADAIARKLTDKPFTLVGHSLGSAIAATFASIRPEQVGSLVLVETVLPAAENNTETLNQLTTHLNYLASPPQHPILADLKTAADRLCQALPSMSEESALKTAHRLTEPVEGGVRWRWDSRLQIRTGIGLGGTVFNRDRYRQILSQIQAPITLIYGDISNFNKPEDLALQQESMPHARRITLPGGHHLHIDAPDAVSKIIAEAALRK